MHPPPPQKKKKKMVKVMNTPEYLPVTVFYNQSDAGDGEGGGERMQSEDKFNFGLSMEMPNVKLQMSKSSPQMET